MRWVFYGLLTLNLVYFGMQLLVYVVPEDVHQQMAVVDSSMPSETLILLREAKTSRVQKEEPLLAEQTPSLCPAVGPWESLEDAMKMVESLSARFSNLELRRIDVERDRLNWVFLPPAESREEALRVLRSLQAQSVDSFIVTEGSDANAISLGYFSNADSARGLQVKMQTAGYPARVRETVRQVREYWLFFSSGLDDQERDRVSGRLTSDAGLLFEDVACQSGELIEL